MHPNIFLGHADSVSERTARSLTPITLGRREGKQLHNYCCTVAIGTDSASLKLASGLRADISDLHYK